jgi:hypothetical protein
MHLAAIALPVAAAIVAAFMIMLHTRRQQLNAGTAPANFPPVEVMNIGQILSGNKIGLTAAFTTTVFFTAPNQGYYALGWNLHIDVTDGAGTLTATVTAPGSPAIPGVQANLATPADGHGPLGVYYLAAGATVTAAVAAGSLGVTTYDFTVFAQRLS